MTPSSDSDFKDYLISKFSKSSQAVKDPKSQTDESSPASIVDYEGYISVYLRVAV